MLFATAELRRSKARFGFLTMGAGLLVFVLLFQQALLASVLDGMSGALTQQSAPVLVYARDAQRAFAGSLVTPEQMAVVDQVEGTADVAELGVTLLSFQTTRDEELVNASVIGFRPDRPGAPTGLSRGRLPETDDEVVASAEDAAGRFGVGDQLTLMPGDVTVTVVGLTEGGRINVGPTLWTTWTMYDILVRLVVPEALVVLPAVMAVQPEPGVTAEALVRTINDQMPELEALTREDAAAKTPGRDAIQIAFLSVMGLGYLVVAVVIGFFFLTMTLQKTPATTLLRAVGVPGGYLVRCLMLQIGTVSLGGLAVGILLLVAVAPLVRSTIVVTVDPGVVLSTAGPVLALAVVGALPPLRRMLRTDPFGAVSRPSLGGLG